MNCGDGLLRAAALYAVPAAGVAAVAFKLAFSHKSVTAAAVGKIALGLLSQVYWHAVNSYCYPGSETPVARFQDQIKIFALHFTIVDTINVISSIALVKVILLASKA